MKLSEHKRLSEANEFLKLGFEEPVFVGYINNYDNIKREYTVQFSADENSAICWVTDTQIIASSNRSCYAGLSYPPDDWKKSPIAVGSKLFYGDAENWRKSKYKPTKEEFFIYMDWVMNRSPFSECFLLHDAQEAIDEGVVFMSPRAPADLMFVAMVATRYTHEFSHFVRAFCHLVSAGVEGNLAFVLIHHFNSSTAAGAIEIGRQGTGHAVLCAEMSKRGVKNFLANKPEKLKGSYATNSDYSCSDAIWDKRFDKYGTDLERGEWITPVLEEFIHENHKLSDSSLKAEVNPFAKPSVEKRAISYDSFIKLCAEKQDELLRMIHA